MSNLLETKFADMGARAKVKHNNFPAARVRSNTVVDGGAIRLDVLKDKNGEFFDIRIFGETPPEVQVLDVQAKDRHLLLLARNAAGDKSKFLCGHDERHWFVAAIPELASVGTVRQAKEALKPAEIQGRQVGLKAKEKNKRKNDVYIRQGEFFFTPAKGINPNPDLILKNEPITRGRGSKPHMCEFMFRTKGESVYVCGSYPNGVNSVTYNHLLKTNKDAKSWGWRQMMKDAEVYVKGKVRHSDHKTIELKSWSLVTMNTENKSRASRNVAFLD